MTPRKQDAPAVALGKLGGAAVREKWAALKALAESGDETAIKELAKCRKAMKLRGKKGGRPKKEKA